MVEVWAALCNRVIVDAGTGLVSLIDLIDKMNVVLLPESSRIPVPTHLSVVTHWRRDDAEQNLVVRQRVAFRRADGEPLWASEPQDIGLQTTHLGRVVTFIPMIVVEGYGQYRFDIERFDQGVWTPPVAWTGLYVDKP